MTDRGFKIKDDLLLTRCTLAIPPSAAAWNQMIASDLKKLLKLQMSEFM